MSRKLKSWVQKIVPQQVISLYHLSLAHLGAIWYGHPSREFLVIAVTGTKGKSSTTEYINAIFEEAGYTTALLNSIRIKVGNISNPNTTGRSMPGRSFIQRFLRRAANAQCSIAILEMTSEGAKQYRHRAIDLDALVFTNLAPEHIESHGSYQKYADAKFDIGLQLLRSKKRPRYMVANGGDPESERYLLLPVEHTLPFSLPENTPWSADSRGGTFTQDGKKMSVQLPGEFSLRNALAAATVTRALGIDTATIARALEKVTRIPGRTEHIDLGQNFAVVVDYAHTPNSLQALFEAYRPHRKICILGSAGGGRDTWKRPVVGKIAEESCAHVILTNDDPYDEDPQKIIDEIASGMKEKPEMILDRRVAIQRAFEKARQGDVVLITGKGIDSMAGPGGVKTAWSDADVAREELLKLLESRTP